MSKYMKNIRTECEIRIKRNAFCTGRSLEQTKYAIDTLRSLSDEQVIELLKKLKNIDKHLSND